MIGEVNGEVTAGEVEGVGEYAGRKEADRESGTVKLVIGGEARVRVCGGGGAESEREEEKGKDFFPHFFFFQRANEIS